MKKEKNSLRACDVINLLRARYPLPAYAFMEQVADGTGARQNRWADAVAMSVWPSRGYRMYGFEVKVSRSDWLSELRKPEKADAMMQYCDGWYLAASDAAIVQADEIPPTWGLMVVKGGRLTVPKTAPQLQPKEFSPALVASLLRNMVVTDEGKMARARSEGERAGREGAVNEEGRSWQMQKLQKLKEQVDAFETASGIRITEYTDGKELGRAVEVVKNLRWLHLAGAITTAKKTVEALEALNAVQALREVQDEAVEALDSST